MLATYHSHTFLPAVPSPLSPRSVNIYGRSPYRSNMSTPPDDSKPSSKDTSENKTVPFSKRPVKKVPTPKQDELQERRRKAFLRRVQDGREDKRFAVRGEDMMRLDFLRDRRAWEAQQASMALDFAADLDFDEEEDDDAYDLPTSSSLAMQSSQMEMGEYDGEADEVLRRENEELEALIANMPSDGMADGRDDLSEHFGSDDDEYDALFSQLMHIETDGKDETSTTALSTDQIDPAGEMHESEAMDTS